MATGRPTQRDLDQGVRMLSPWKGRKWRVVLAGIILVVPAGIILVLILVKVADWFIWLRQPPDIRQYLAVRAEWQSTEPPISQATKERLVSRCLGIARGYPGTVGGL